MKFLIRFLSNTVAILLIAYLFPGLIRVESWKAALLAALLLGIVNAVVRPIVVILTLPLTLITLGLFLLIINALMLGLVAYLVPGFYVHGFFGAIAGSILISLISWILSHLLR